MDQSGFSQHEGGPCVLTKNSCGSNKCSPDVIHKFLNLGSDLIGLMIGDTNDLLPFNSGYLWPYKSIDFVIGDPSCMPSAIVSSTSSNSMTNKS